VIYEHGKARWNDTDREEQNNAEKSVPHATLSITNPTWTATGGSEPEPEEIKELVTKWPRKNVTAE
jgi:hypothetical protein